MHPQDVTPTELRMPESLLGYKDVTPTEFYRTYKKFRITNSSVLSTSKPLFRLIQQADDWQQNL